MSDMLKRGSNPERKREREIQRIAQAVSGTETFKAVSIAAMKARAGHLSMGDVVSIGSLQFVVEEDDEGVFVQIIVSRESVDGLASRAAGDLGLDLPGAGEMEGVLKEIEDILKKWHQVRLRSGPGENITLEKTAYGREPEWRQV